MGKLAWIILAIVVVIGAFWIIELKITIFNLQNDIDETEGLFWDCISNSDELVITIREYQNITEAYHNLTQTYETLLDACYR